MCWHFPRQDGPTEALKSASLHCNPGPEDPLPYIVNVNSAFGLFMIFCTHMWHKTQTIFLTCFTVCAGIPYSEHSSFTELQQFVEQLRPERVVATVGGQSPHRRNEMNSYFDQWKKGPSPNKPRIRQTSIDSLFISRS